MVLAPSFAVREKQGDLVSPGVPPRFGLRAGSLREAQQRPLDLAMAPSGIPHLPTPRARSTADSLGAQS